jgi:hypothetical protein
MDSDFLPQIRNEEELETFLNNLEFLKSWNWRSYNSKSSC